MTNVTQIKTTFTAGEVSPELLGRGDLRAYDNGAKRLRNVFIKPTGGVTRRSGLRYVDTVPANGRLISFEFNTEQTYLLVLTDERLDIYFDGGLEETLATPWTAAQVAQIVWTQSADTLLLTHPDYPPKKLIRSGLGVWTLEDWAFFTEANVIHQPYYKFAGTNVTVTPSGTSGTVTLTASAACFVANHAGTRLRVGNKEVSVTTVNSPTVVTVSVIQTLSGTAATIDWEEQAFSNVHGYPVSVAFHQDRLIVGGSRDLPNRLWFSCSGDLFNFDRGTGLDDEAIEFAILSDQVNAIRNVFSGRHLQVFTSGAEWMVTGEPLTPQNVQIRRQTRVGSVIGRNIQPVDVDGATLFIARNRQELREFVYTDVEQAYQATDLALVSRHIIVDPVDQDFDQLHRLLFIVREDGKFATLTVYRGEQVAAWTLHETDGLVKSVSVVGDIVYLLIERNGNFTIEQFDETLNLDSALTGSAGSPTISWAGLEHLNGKSVSILADGMVQTPKTVSGGSVTLDEAASEVEIGLAYTHIIEPLPPANMSNTSQASRVRLVKAIFRLHQSAALRLDTGRGLKDITLRQIGDTPILDAPPPLFSGDMEVRAFGWHTDKTETLWRIEQSLPFPFTLLAVATDLKIND